MSEITHITTQNSAQERNQEIKALTANGKIPVLPFEIQALRRIFGGLAERQRENAILLGESMQVSSETWHDNAAAEMINADSLGLSNQAEKLSRTVRGAVDLGYPHKDLGHVTLGSLVSVRYSTGDIEPILITGAVTELPDFTEFGLPAGCEALTLRSPLGLAILGTEPGSEVRYPVGDRIMSSEIVDLQQIDLS